MRILVVATKPPWPPQDGGRLVLWTLLQGLTQAGHELHVIAPGSGELGGARVLPALAMAALDVVPVPARSWPAALAVALWRRESPALARHRHRAMQAAVARALTRFRPEVVHVEQLQAFGNCEAVLRAQVPLLLRMQNVESDLWSQLAASRPSRRPLHLAAHGVRAAERRALRLAKRVVALTDADAAMLRAGVGGPAAARIEAIAPQFESTLPAGAACEGEPAIALAGSGGWRPNQDALRWMLSDVAPRLAATLPRARLHLFGAVDGGVANAHVHPAPADAIDAFPAGAIAAVPLFAGSGIRMRILEAWARGLPVVATSIAARGLPVTDGRELLIADTAADFVDALRRLHGDRALRAALVQAGREHLRRHHDPARQTAAIEAAYRAAIAAR